MPSLIGHLSYGTALGLTYHHFESRFSPWWIPQRRADAARSARRREQVLTSALAIWGARHRGCAHAARDPEHLRERFAPRLWLTVAAALAHPLERSSAQSSARHP